MREQGVGVNPKLSGECLDRVEGEVAFSALDSSEVTGSDLQLLGHALLGESSSQALGSDVGAQG